MKKYLCLFLLFFFPFNAFAAIAFDSNSANVTNGGNPTTASFTNTAGNFIACFMSPAANDVSSVTWNGSSMTQAGTPLNSNSRFQQAWYIENAVTGTHNVVVNGDADVYVRCMSFSGVATSGSVSGYNTHSGTSATPTLAVTTTVNNSFVLAGGQTDTVLTAGANTTLPSAGVNPQIGAILYSTAAVTPAGSFTINANASNGGAYGLVGFAISPPVAAAASSYSDDEWLDWFTSGLF